MEGGKMTKITGKKEFKAQEKPLTKPKGRKWDGRSRITTKAYRENYDAIYKRRKNEGKNI